MVVSINQTQTRIVFCCFVFMSPRRSCTTTRDSRMVKRRRGPGQKFNVWKTLGMASIKVTWESLNITVWRPLLMLCWNDTRHSRAEYATAAVSTLMFTPKMKRCFIPVRFARYFCDQLCDRHRLYQQGQSDAKVGHTTRDRLVHHFPFRFTGMADWARSSAASARPHASADSSP